MLNGSVNKSLFQSILGEGGIKSTAMSLLQAQQVPISLDHLRANAAGPIIS